MHWQTNARLWDDLRDCPGCEPDMQTIPIKRRAVRRDKTARVIKRHLFQLTKYWVGGRCFYSFHEPYNDNKFYLEPHRMHKQYAHVSDIHGEEDWYRYKIHNRAQWNREHYRTSWDWEYSDFDNCLCENCAYEHHRSREEYYEVYSENWNKYWLGFTYDVGWDEEIFSAQQDRLFYKLCIRITMEECDSLNLLYYDLSQMEKAA